MKRILILLALVCLLLCGCGHSTTVILPPNTTGTAIPETSTDITGPTSTVSNATVPSMEISAAGTETTEPTADTTEPPAPPSIAPSSDSTTAPTTPTDPPTEPVTEPETADVYDISGHTIGSLEYAIWAELNARREAENLPGLTMDSKLCALAAIRAYECSLNRSHTRPDGRDCYTVLTDYGYGNWAALGENILTGNSGFSAAQIVETWSSYPVHEANIMCPDFTNTGIGIYYSGDRIYIVNLFAG